MMPSGSLGMSIELGLNYRTASNAKLDKYKATLTRSRMPYLSSTQKTAA